MRVCVFGCESMLEDVVSALSQAEQIWCFVRPDMPDLWLLTPVG